MPFKDPKSEAAKESQKRRSKKYREIKRNDPDWKETQRLKQQEHRNKYRKTHNDCARISHWKTRGIKCDNNDYDKFLQLYNETEKCYVCNCELHVMKGNTSNRKVADHHHSSGYFRHVLCNKCNIKRGEIDRKHLSVLLELHRHSFLN